MVVEMSRPEILPDSLLTSYQVGSLLQVNPSSINKWVKDGRIPAFRTPGGHRRIRAADLVAFLMQHKMPVPRSLASASKRRLLIVDDDAKQLEALARLFKGQSDRIDISLVNNGVDALVQIGSIKPHVAILDVFMPMVDGLEVCRRLKSSPDTAATRIIVTSGQLTPEIEQKAHEAGADVVTPKPLDPNVVLKELEISAQLPF
ncbi:MAG: response regulator [Deltaproteobacteria bacterium]|nr:response regulator [Deltaproteobacteria bacterium]